MTAAEQGSATGRQLGETARTGVIHDIGYRGYDGVRLGRGAIRRALFAHSLRGVYGLGRSGKSKVLPFAMLAVTCLPALILAAVAVIGARQGLLDDLLVSYSRYPISLQAAVAIFLAAQAPQALSLDLRYKTVPLYFSRPLERVDYVAAKYAAVASGAFLLMAVPLLILYVGALLAEFPAGEHTAEMLASLVTVALLALVMGGVSAVIAATTARRGFAIAGVVTVLVLTFATVSALQGVIGHGQGNMAAAGWLGLLSPVTLIDGVQVWLFGVDSSVPAGPPDGAGPVFLLVAVGLVAGCVAVLLRRYRKVFA